MSGGDDRSEAAQAMESSLSPGDDQEEYPQPWLGFHTICNGYSGVDDEDEPFMNFDGLIRPIHCSKYYDESSDEDHSGSDDEKSANDEDDDYAGEDVLDPTHVTATAAPALQIDAGAEEGSEGERPLSPWNNK